MTEKMRWWSRSRFGMIIHWGLYSLLGGEWRGQRTEHNGEWIMSRFRIPVAEYEALAKSFAPVRFDARRICELARRAGMGYLVFTAKHHDGFAMYHSPCDPYNVVDATPFGRDPAAELAAACAEQGLAMGFYYSQSLDWHDPDSGGAEPGQTPNHGMSWGNDWAFPSHQQRRFSRYLEEKVKPQLTELLTQYGRIGVLWFDCPFTIRPEQSRELYDLVQSLQPGCIVNSRLGNGLGDFQSLGDNMIPDVPLPGYNESVGTLNETWGYKHFDLSWKSSEEVITLLASLAGKGCNYALNLGPTGLGEVPQATAVVLEEVGEWMERNGESIVGTDATPFATDLPSGPVTRGEYTLYLHLHRLEGERVTLNGIRSRVTGVRLLGEETAAPTSLQHRDPASGIGRLEVRLPASIARRKLPVLAVETEGAPRVEDGLYQQADGSVALPASRAMLHSGEPGGAMGSERFGLAGPDGEPGTFGGPLCLSRLGAVANWHSSRDWISWELRIVEAGVFEVGVLTTGLRYDNPWQGGHRVCIVVEGQRLEATLLRGRELRSPGTRWFRQVSSPCGLLRLEAGRHSLELRALEILRHEPDVGLALLRVELRPVSSAR